MHTFTIDYSRTNNNNARWGIWDQVINTQCFRLYYLYQGPKVVYPKEESLLRFLCWYCPFLAATLVTMNMTENFVLYPDHPFLFHYGHCAKISYPQAPHTRPILRSTLKKLLCTLIFYRVCPKNVLACEGPHQRPGHA